RRIAGGDKVPRRDQLELDISRLVRSLILFTRQFRTAKNDPQPRLEAWRLLLAQVLDNLCGLEALIECDSVSGAFLLELSTLIVGQRMFSESWKYFQQPFNAATVDPESTMTGCVSQADRVTEVKAVLQGT